MSSVTGIKAGKAFVLIEAIDVTGKVLSKIRDRLGKFGTEMSKVGMTMAMRGAAALTPIGLAVKTGIAYDDIMRKVAARSDGTAAEMSFLREQTLKLGQALGILPSRMGSIQNIFAQAGFSRSEISQIGPAVATLARAGGEGADAAMDADNAAKALSAVLRGYNMEASKAAEVSDKLAVALNASNFDLQDITTSLQYAVPAANMFNVPMEEMLAILGAMRDLQIDASIAGTAFRNMMGYMSQAKEQENFNEQLKELTGQTIEFTDALGNLHSPIRILPAILKATEGLGTAERSDLLTQLLETRATVPGAAVGRSIDRMSDMLTRLANFKGEASRIQKAMDEGLGGSFRRFAAVVEVAAIKIEKALTPILKTATTAIDGILSSFTKWVALNPQLFVGIVSAVAAVTALGVGLIILGQATIALSALFGIGAALASITAAALAFVGPWAAALLGLKLGFDAIDKFRDDGVSTAGMVSASFGRLAENLSAIGNSIKANITELTSHVKESWSDSMNVILDSLAKGDILTAFNVFAANVKLTWLELMDYLKTKWETFLQWVLNVQSQAAAILLVGGSKGKSRQMGWEEAEIYRQLEKEKKGLKFAEDALTRVRASGQNPDFHLKAIENSKREIARLEKLLDIERRSDSSTYADALRATMEGQFAEAQLPGTKEAQELRKQEIAAAKANLEAAKFNRIRQDTEAERLRMEEEFASEGSLPTSAGVAAKSAELSRAADALIKTGDVARTSAPKGAADAYLGNSAEAMRQFLEARYETSDEALEYAKKSEGHLDEIRRLLGEGSGLSDADGA